MNMQRIAGTMLMIGSLLFLIAAFSPIAQVFSEPDEAKKMEILMNGARDWTVDQIFFALGSLVTAAGFALIAFQFRTTPQSWLVIMGLAVVVIGAGLWSWNVYLRAIDPQAFVGGTLPAWPFIVYTILTQAGFAVFGIALLRSDLPGWTGWVLFGGSLLFFIVFLIYKDMPPFAYYILTLPTGLIMVIRKAPKHGQILLN